MHNESALPNPNLCFWLKRHAALRPNHVAIHYWHSATEREGWTYEALAVAVRRLAHWLRESGVKAGDRVAFLDLNDIRYVITMYAAASLGAVFVPLNFRLATPELVAIVEDCDAMALIYGGAYHATRDALAEQTNCRIFLTSDREGDDGFQRVCNAAMAPSLDLPDTQWDEVAWLLYTSGSTGRPKGVMLSHGNIFWNTLNTILIQGGLPTDNVLLSAPLFHAAPVCTLMETFLRGATLHLERAFNASGILERIEAERISVIAGVPAMYQFIANHESFNHVDLSSLRSIIVGGAPVPEALIRRYRQRGVSVIHRYGLTEAAPLVTALTPGSPESKASSAGLPPIFGDMRLADAQGAAVSAGEVGEIQMRGPNIMLGYWRQPEATDAVLVDGWLHTGDLGRVDQDGYLTVAGRIKDMIISGGENIYVTEVEAQLAENPDILESVVIGIPHPKWGESVCAVVAPVKASGLTEARVLDHLQGRLARYKQPTKVIILDKLPKNGAGKVDKLQLKRLYGIADAEAVEEEV